MPLKLSAMAAVLPTTRRGLFHENGSPHRAGEPSVKKPLMAMGRMTGASALSLRLPVMPDFWRLVMLPSTSRSPLT